jgi:hypothetical protein
MMGSLLKNFRCIGFGDDVIICRYTFNKQVIVGAEKTLKPIMDY